MLRFIARRLLWMAVIMFAISLITFFLMKTVPGGPFDREKPLPAATRKNLEAKYNLNASLPEQYLDYMGGILIPRITTEKLKPALGIDYLINIPLPFLGEETALRWMNFGPSFTQKGRSVNRIFTENLPVSFNLGVAALIVSCTIGIPLGIISALRRNTAYDYLGMGVAILGVSVPVLISAPVLQYLVGVQWKLLPVTWTVNDDWSVFQNLILPAFTLGFVNAALIARLTRASLLQVMNEDYIRTARAKGMAERRVVGIHALKNSMIPVITILGPLLAALVTGTFIVETTFAIPGMGKFFVTSITARDYTVIMGTVLLYALFLVVCNLLVDLTYAWLDPRIRFD
jgi:ABC-type dipeptide/oligopeptide/nickel transport system permease component